MSETTTAPHIDPAIARLPEQAQKKLEYLERIEDRASALARGLSEQYGDAREALAAAQGDLAHFDRRHGARVPDDHPERLALIQRIEAARDDLRRLGAEQQGTHPGFSTEDLRSWLRAQGPRAKFAAVDARLRVSKRERAAEALEANRQAQAVVRDQIAVAQNAPRTKAELRTIVRDQIAAFAARGTPEVSDDGTINWPTTQTVSIGGTAAVSATVPDALALLLWAIGPEKIAVRLEADLPSDPDAMTAQDQRAAVAHGQAELLRLQHEAEALTVALEGDGAFVRRNGVPPAVLLGIEITR